MKSMTCKDLGGACDTVFKANTFEGIADQSKQHGMEMVQKGDEAHIKAMGEMQKVMEHPQAMVDWMMSKQKEFEALPEE